MEMDTTEFVKIVKIPHDVCTYTMEVINDVNDGSYI